MSLASAIGKDDMVLLLQHVPHLKYLELNCNPPSGINSNNIQTLITLSATSSLVPGLEQVVFDYDTDFDFQLLVTMIKSRCQVIRAVEIGNIDLVTYKKLDPQVSMIGPLEALELAHNLDIWIAEVDSEG
ncbi:hypothetical protein FIBSPDRAFT_961802 [Athelia psychrophila]|uniref:RNI-like protein n=1 Tax=Athelia psychrophila TaxID=1759441 RepID=A0A166AV78_9AGAM|nr:hypothetical protein FIBSPDRAFT_961802 [Fibularhizoctonia sp. CBS 109695]